MSVATMSSNSLLSLNYDVLSLIVVQLPPSDASRLALTSRDAYSLAMPRFLSSVSLGGLFHKTSANPTLQLKQFASFILSQPARALSLHRLEVMRDAVRIRDPTLGYTWSVDRSSVALLTSVLALCKNLQELTLWGADALFAAHPPLTSVLASLPVLHSVTLGGDVPPLPTLARSLPQVRSLVFVDGGGACGPDWDSHKSVEDNQWTHLDAVDAGFPILPLARHVRKIDLRNALYADADQYVVGSALTFVAQSQPVVLSCVLDRTVDEKDFAQRLAEVNPGIKYLQVVLERCDSLADTLAWMTRIARPLAALSSLQGLSLCRAGYVPPTDDLPLPIPLNDASSALPPLARDIAGVLPSVRWVGLQPWGQKAYNTYEPVWFTVDRVGKQMRDVRSLQWEEGRSLEAALSKLDIYD